MQDGIDSTKGIGVDINVIDNNYDLLANTMNRAKSILDNNKNAIPSSSPSNNVVANEEAAADKSTLKWSYLSQAYMVAIVLAHSLWVFIRTLIKNKKYMKICLSKCFSYFIAF